MWVNEIDAEVLANYLRVNLMDIDYAEFNLLESVIKAAKAYVREYTGLTPAALNKHEDLAMAVMVVSQDMYDNRAMIADRNYVNETVRSLLDLHSVNLVGKGG